MHEPRRRTSKYLDVANEPLFPFGHGLTYGRFELTDLHLSSTRLGPKDSLEVSITVRNHGVRTAEETVFLFVHDKVASVARPMLTQLLIAPLHLVWTCVC